MCLSTASTFDTTAFNRPPKFIDLRLYRFGMSHAFACACVSNKGRMLKISVVESHTQRRVIVEGKLIAPWVAELRTACEQAKTDLEERELIIDLKNVTAITREGEDALLELMKQRAKFRCGVFTKHVLRILTRKRRGPVQNAD